MSRVKQFMKIVETGEPDQDYDKETYDAICKGLKGFKCSHREFDKYQGVYITTSKGGRTAKIWTVDSYVTGKRKSPRGKFSSAVLIGDDGEEYSASRGDYFMRPAGYVFQGSELVLTDHQGKETRIENPKLSDLPDLLDVEHTISYEGEPDQVLVLWIEGTDEEDKYEVKVTADGKADTSELKAGLDHYFKGKK